MTAVDRRSSGPGRRFRPKGRLPGVGRPSGFSAGRSAAVAALAGAGLATYFLAVHPRPASAQEGAGLAAVRDTLSLDRAQEIARRRSPEIRRAVAGQSRAHAERRADWGAFLPQASAGASLSRSEFTTVTFPAPDGTAERLDEPRTSTTHGASQSLSLSWDLLRGGRRFAEFSAGAARTTAADRRVSAAERRVAGQVKAAYYDALQQQRLVEVAERQLEGRRRDLEVARRRYELAAVSRSDVLGARIALNQAEIALSDARGLADQFQRQLQAAMGVEGRVEADLVLREVGELPDASRLDPEALVRRALATDPEAAALQADVSAASAAAWSARSSYLPTIQLRYGLTRSETLGPEGSLFNFDLSNDGSSFSVSASWNLFDGFGRESQVAAQTAAKREAEAALVQRRLQLRQEVRDLTDEILRRARRLEVQEENFRLAEERLDMAREQYRLGTISYFDLQNAIRDLTSSEQAVIRERYAYLKAWAGLEERVGEVP